MPTKQTQDLRRKLLRLEDKKALFEDAFEELTNWIDSRIDDINRQILKVAAQLEAEERENG